MQVMLLNHSSTRGKTCSLGGSFTVEMLYVKIDPAGIQRNFPYVSQEPPVIWWKISVPLIGDSGFFLRILSFVNHSMMNSATVFGCVRGKLSGVLASLLVILELHTGSGNSRKFCYLSNFRIFSIRIRIEDSEKPCSSERPFVWRFIRGGGLFAILNQ